MREQEAMALFALEAAMERWYLDFTCSFVGRFSVVQLLSCYIITI